MSNETIISLWLWLAGGVASVVVNRHRGAFRAPAVSRSGAIPLALALCLLGPLPLIGAAVVWLWDALTDYLTAAT